MGNNNTVSSGGRGNGMEHIILLLKSDYSISTPYQTGAFYDSLTPPPPSRWRKHEGYNNNMSLRERWKKKGKREKRGREGKTRFWLRRPMEIFRAYVTPVVKRNKSRRVLDRIEFPFAVLYE